MHSFIISTKLGWVAACPLGVAFLVLEADVFTAAFFVVVAAIISRIE